LEYDKVAVTSKIEYVISLLEALYLKEVATDCLEPNQGNKSVIIPAGTT